MPLIQISHLDFAYAEQLVLKHIDLAVERGSTLGLIGPNGGGKTTLLRLLLGLLKPTRGKILIAGMTTKQAIGNGGTIGYLPQNPSTPTHFPLSVRQAITLGLAGEKGLLGPYLKDDLNFLGSLIERVGVGGLAGGAGSTLSGGGLERGVVARGRGARAAGVLLDGPTT